MPLSTVIALVLSGVAIGIISGMVGIGGGILVIPTLMFFFGFTQAQANGTSLAMLLPPIGIFAVLAYRSSGNVNWEYAIPLACGFAAGAYLGALLVNRDLINPAALRIAFVLLLIYVAARILFHPGGRATTALEVSLLFAGFAIIHVIMRLLGRNWKPKSGWPRMKTREQKFPLDHDYEI